MTDPADFHRRDAAPRRTQRTGGKKPCVPRVASSLRFIPIAAMLARAIVLDASVPGTPPLPTVSRPVTTTNTATDAAALKKLLFGLGVGFDRFAGAQGVGISRVLPDSPAARAGLTVGCVIMEINGVVTTGRTGEDCARIIQNAFGPVRMKVLDPEQREKTLRIGKAWLPMPESALPYAP